MRIANGIGWFVILVLRGLLLWILIPFAFLAWLLVHSWLQGASLRQSLSWYDRNLVTGIVNGPFRLLIKPEPRPQFVRVSDMATMKPHVVSWLDVR